MSKEFPIVERLGGRQAVMDILRARGVEVSSVATIRMWSSPTRKKIPGTAVVELMAHCEEQRIAYESADFRLHDDDPAIAETAA